MVCEAKCDSEWPTDDDAALKSGDSALGQQLDPLRNVTRRSNGRPSGLTDAVKQQLAGALDKDPFGGVKLVWKTLREDGLCVSQ